MNMAHAHFDVTAEWDGFFVLRFRGLGTSATHCHSPNLSFLCYLLSSCKDVIETLLCDIFGARRRGFEAENPHAGVHHRPASTADQRQFKASISRTDAPTMDTYPSGFLDRASIVLARKCSMYSAFQQKVCIRADRLL